MADAEDRAAFLRQWEPCADCGGEGVLRTYRGDACRTEACSCSMGYRRRADSLTEAERGSRASPANLDERGGVVMVEDREGRYIVVRVGGAEIGRISTTLCSHCTDEAVCSACHKMAERMRAAFRQRGVP